jgi:hypothetical protein
VKSFVVLNALALSMAGAASAAPAPRLVPDRDVTVEYQLFPPGQPEIPVRAEIAAGGIHVRATSDEIPAIVIVNRQTETASLLVPLLRAYANVGIGKYDPETTVLRGASFSRVGHDVLAGQPCTRWQAVSPHGTANACITADGVILAGSAHSDRKGDLGSVRAIRVSYGALPPNAFDIPADFVENPLAQSALKMMR